MYSLKLTPEQIEIRRMVRRFAEGEIRPVALQLDRTEDFEARFPRDILREASQLGLRTLSLSEKNNGGGVDNLTSCIVSEELAAGDVGIATTLNQTSTLAALWFDQLMNDAQRERFLPDFLEDHDFHLCTAGHEPDTDPGWVYQRATVPGTGYRTTAVRDSDGSWIIDGTKNFITNGPVAKLIAVHCQTGPSVGGTAGVSTILVPAGTPGLTIFEHDKVGRRLGSNGEMVFEECRVPAENLLGREGESALAAVRRSAPAGHVNLEGRGMPRFQALNLGIGRAAYEAAVEYAGMRIQGGRPIVGHQAVGLQLADMAIDLEAARSLIWQAAWASDHSECYADGSVPDVPLQWMAKVFTSQAVFRVATRAAEIFGGMGVMRELPMQKYVRDALIYLHSEHSNDVAKLKIAEKLTGFERTAQVATAAQ